MENGYSSIILGDVEELWEEEIEDVIDAAEHDTRMYRWSSKKEKLMMIAGHTHRPVWSSVTHLEKLIRELYALQGRKKELPPKEYQEKVKQLKRQIKSRQEKYPPGTDTIKTRPSYFNTGWCRFKDGDITGLELVDGEIRLIKWGIVNDYKHRSFSKGSSLPKTLPSNDR